ncbi:hypothetical protein NDU88_006656 [Pleurodeles waltl]|uniref:Uncharacterized protein n=1 Tax=Pleurodeles waltl TaxID=8319 RepID=A0AAV7X256_PLEWA|nr:hypothetical protein NDU88_006656 [Pleurodeles waltl]
MCWDPTALPAKYATQRFKDTVRKRRQAADHKYITLGDGSRKPKVKLRRKVEALDSAQLHGKEPNQEDLQQGLPSQQNQHSHNSIVYYFHVTVATGETTADSEKAGIGGGGEATIT